ncbi:MAG: hypothetical protein ACPHO8_19035, partial [Mariniblastus sp.]
PAPKTTKGVRTHRNQSGVVGVHLSVCESAYGKVYSSYCASWKTKDGSRRKISFSFKKYTKKLAWELACLARELESIDRSKIERTLQSRTGKKTRSQSAEAVNPSRKTKKKVKKGNAKTPSR